jgi:hypothetical protein
MVGELLECSWQKRRGAYRAFLKLLKTDTQFYVLMVFEFKILKKLNQYRNIQNHYIIHK